jgi:four helix bundle protein
MENETKPTGAQVFVAFEVALEVIRSLRDVVAKVRKHNRRIADQIVESASSIASNVEEGNRRAGKDRVYLFRVAAGSAAETRAHLRVALAWGWVEPMDIEPALEHLDRIRFTGPCSCACVGCSS